MAFLWGKVHGNVWGEQVPQLSMWAGFWRKCTGAVAGDAERPEKLVGGRASAGQADGQIWGNSGELEVLIANIGFGLFGGQTGHPDPIEARNFDRCFGINHVQPDACDTTVAHSKHVCGF